MKQLISCVHCYSPNESYYTLVRLALTRATTAAIPPAPGDRRATGGARGDGGATLPPPGSSGRYRPAIARIGGDRRAVAAARAGDAVARAGVRRAVRPAVAAL